MSWLALTASFEYLCYGSTTIIIVTLTVQESTLDSESDVYRRQILTSKVDPPTVRVKWSKNILFFVYHMED